MEKNKLFEQTIKLQKQMLWTTNWDEKEKIKNKLREAHGNELGKLELIEKKLENKKNDVINLKLTIEDVLTINSMFKCYEELTINYLLDNYEYEVWQKIIGFVKEESDEE